MKTCFKCGRALPLVEFYRHPRMADGHLNKCKDCTKADIAKREKEMRLDPIWLASERDRHRVKQARYRVFGSACPTSQKTKTAWAIRNPEKIYAQRSAMKAKRSGKIVSTNKCQQCGRISSELEMHHHDYSKPLDVIFLCRPCHGKTRRKIAA